MLVFRLRLMRIGYDLVLCGLALCNSLFNLVGDPAIKVNSANYFLVSPGDAYESCQRCIKVLLVIIGENFFVQRGCIR